MDDTSGLFVGLISGTSADGIDAALVRFVDGRAQLLEGITHPWPEPLREQLLAIGQAQKQIDLDALGQLDVAIGARFGEATLALLAKAKRGAHEVIAVGSHGQTVRHRPTGPLPFTLQLGDPSVIAEACGITVVAGFRRADVAAGGQGAPLLPAMHAMLLDARPAARAVLNLGGIANVTYLAGDGHVTGFDTGPANGLLDAWCQRHCGQAYDRDGRFAAQGQVDEALLAHLLADPYFAQPPPKSTGREYFHLAWLDARLGHGADPRRPQDVQATLLALTVRSVGDAIARHAQKADDVLVCGGGVHNPVLMGALRSALAPRAVCSTADFGVDPDFLEAMAFAWLARQRLLLQPGNLPAVTGARGPRVLGAVYAPPPDA